MKKIKGLRKKTFLSIILIFFISVGGSLPLIYFEIIDPRLGLMSASIGISSMEISAVDDISMTFVIKLKVMGPFDKNIIVPKLDLNAYAGFLPLGVAWSPMEFVIFPYSFLLDYNAFLYLRVFRGPGSAINELFDALMHESNLPIELIGNAMIGGLPFAIPPMAFSLTPNPYDPLTIILDAINPEETDMVEDFLNYIQENGVNFNELTSVIDLDALGLVNYLTERGINIFSLFNYLDTKKEWSDGFEIDNSSPIVNRSNRIGVEQAIYSALYGNPEEDIKTNLMKIAWDLDDIEVFNGTPWSRVDNTTYAENFTFAGLSGPTNFTFEQAQDPSFFWYSFFQDLGINNMVRDRLGPDPLGGHSGIVINIQPNWTGKEYNNNTLEEWNYSYFDPEKEVSYMRFAFYNNATFPFFDVEGDGNVSTFNADNLSIYDLRTYNPSDPESSLLWRVDNDNINYAIEWRPGAWWGEGANYKYYTPWFPTNSVKIVFKTNGTNSANYTGFYIRKSNIDFDTPFENCPVGNFTAEPLDNDTFDVAGKTYFNPAAFLKFDMWHQCYALYTTIGALNWNQYWNKLTVPNILAPWQNPLDADWTSNGMSDWDLLWWLHRHWDMRYLLEISAGLNELFWALSNLGALMDPQKQTDFFYGDMLWSNATTSFLLKTLPDFPVTSAAHAFVDFYPGAPYANMSEPLKIVKTWEFNPTTGTYDYYLQNHTLLYGVTDISGTGGPYEADEGYMKALKYNDICFIENMLYVALTQDSRDPNSIWAMMNQWQIDNLGAVQPSTDTTYWNTQPLPLEIFINAVLEAAESAGGGGAGLSGLLYGYDIFELVNYIMNKTGVSMGEIFDAAGIRMNDVITFIADGIKPTFLPIPLEPNIMKLEDILIWLTPAFIAAPAIAIYLYISRRRKGDFSIKK